MSVPPSGRRPSSTPSSKGSPDDTKESQRPFQMPGRKEKAQEQEEKKKGLFELAQEDMGIQAKQQGLQQNAKTEEIEPGLTAVTGTAAAAQVTQVGQLIQKMVETMYVGQVGGKEFASLNLKTSADVPNAFAGSNLTVSYETNSLTIHFDNFMSPQQQNTAISLVEKNKEQLLQMVEALGAKNIQIAELTIGTHVVALPRPAGLPAPFQPVLTAETEGTRREDHGYKERDQDEPE